MERTGSELLIYVLIVAAFLAFNFLMQQLAKKAKQRQEEAEAANPRPAPVPDDEPLENIWGRGAEAVVVEPLTRQGNALVTSSGPAPAPAPRRIPTEARPRIDARKLFRTPQDLRTAVIMMTVLGPCRALDPYDRE
jgi:hypothetical protein